MTDKTNKLTCGDCVMDPCNKAISNNDPMCDAGKYIHELLAEPQKHHEEFAKMMDERDQLCEENERLKADYKRHTTWLDESIEGHAKCIEEIKQLREENKKLKQFIEDTPVSVLGP